MARRIRESGNRAIGYVRVSTEEQARSGLGLAAQDERVRAYATAAGLELIAVVREEGVSGSVLIAERDGGRKVLDAIRKGEVGHVIALKLDRLFRDAADCLNQTRAWDTVGVALHLLDMGGQAINTGSAMGRMFLTIAAGFAELERNLIAERTAAALEQKRRRGEWTGGDAPYGWRVAADGRKLEPVPAEQEAIRAALALDCDGLSLRRVGAALAERGFLPRRGAWAASKVASILRQAERVQTGAVAA